MSEAGMHTSEAGRRDVEHFQGRLTALMTDAVGCLAPIGLARPGQSCPTHGLPPPFLCVARALIRAKDHT